MRKVFVEMGLLAASARFLRASARALFFDRSLCADTEDASETDMVKQREEECTEIKEQ